MDEKKKKGFFAKIKPLEWILIAISIIIITTIIVVNVGGGVHVAYVNSNLWIFYRVLLSFGSSSEVVRDIFGNAIHTQNFITFLFIGFLYSNLLVAIALILYIIRKRSWRTIIGAAPFLLGAGLTLYSGTFFYVGIQPILDQNILYFSSHPGATFTDYFPAFMWACICLIGTLTAVVYIVAGLSLVISVVTATKEAEKRKASAKALETEPLVDDVEQLLVRHFSGHHVPAKETIVIKEVKEAVVATPAVKAVVVPSATAEKKEPYPERIPFVEKLEGAEKDIKDKYNVVKSHLLAYGVKSRISISGDTFRLHTEEYAVVTVIGRHLKIYLPLNLKDYKDTAIPVIDASHFKKYGNLPVAFNIRSDLSLRRALKLIDDAMLKKGLVMGEEVAKNHASVAIRGEKQK